MLARPLPLPVEHRDANASNPALGEALVFAVEPRNVFAFGKGTFGQTRYQLQ